MLTVGSDSMTVTVEAGAGVFWSFRLKKDVDSEPLIKEPRFGVVFFAFKKTRDTVNREAPIVVGQPT